MEAVSEAAAVEAVSLHPSEAAVVEPVSLHPSEAHPPEASLTHPEASLTDSEALPEVAFTIATMAASAFMRLRVRPETSGRIAEFSEHEAD